MEKVILPQMIDHFRKLNGWTMKELGIKMGKTESAISKWISGDRSPMVDDLDKLVSLFNTDIKTLTYGGSSDSLFLSEISEVISQLNSEEQEQVLKFARNELDERIRDTMEIMAKANETLKDKIFSYAKFEYFEYEKEQESKKSQNTAS